MNLKRITRKKKVKDDFRVAPSASLIKRLVSGLESSHEIIERYFPHNTAEDEYLSDLENMMAYFNGYKQ